MTRGGYRLHAGRKPADVKRDERIMIRLTEQELAELTVAAYPGPVSTWVRDVAMEAARKKNEDG